jgi:uncharacterized protein YceH (UPF0502 family)
MPVCLHALTDGQLNQHLEARGSRTSGTRRQREERLQRFLDFEDQKKRRNEYVERMRAEKDAAVDDSTCTYGEQEDRVARVLMDLRDDAERSEYYINHLLPRVKALEDIIASMEKRITELETADMPPLMPILQDSNPNWVYDNSTSPYAWECTQFT